MNDTPGRELAAFAQAALRDIDDEQLLRANPLLRHLHGQNLPHDRLRAHVLRVLESLDPGSSSDPLSERRKRAYTILLRCDLQRVSHKEVAATLGLSRRQFYRDRRAAMLAFAAAVPKQPVHIVEVSDPKAVHLVYISTLRERGRHDAVWRECRNALAEMKGHPREAEVLTIASEAGRLIGDIKKSRDAIETMHGIAARDEHPHLRRATALRITICEAALDWMLADTVSARQRIDDAARNSGDERTMHGRDATLFSILLNYGAWIAMDQGDWKSSFEFTRRSERLAERSELGYTPAHLHRLRGRLALNQYGDAARAAVELRDALAIADRNMARAPTALCAVELGLALLPSDAPSGLEYVRYGLAIGRDACGYDDFAVLYAAAAPLLLPFAPEDTREQLSDLRARSPLARRADLFTRVAECELLLHAGEGERASAAAHGTSEELERSSLFPAAAESRVMWAEALAMEHRTVAARRALKRAHELIAVHGTAKTRGRALALGTHLAL